MNTVLALGLLVASASALHQMEPTVNAFTSKNWIKERRASQGDVVKANIVLKHDPEALKKFEKDLLDIATPSSKNYGKWMTADQVKQALSPKENAIKVVTDYLSSFGVNATKINKFGDIIQVTMSAAVAEKVFSTEFAAFRSVTERDLSILRITKPYFLPESVASVVSVVDDIMRFPYIKKPLLSSGAEATASDEFSSCGAKCNGYTTPDVLKSAYGYSAVAAATPGNSMSVAEFQRQYYDTVDLNTFSSACGVTVTVDDNIGGNNENLCEVAGCVESLLDIEYIGAISHPVPLQVIYSSDYSLFDWVNAVMEQTNPPLVNSVSYGNDEIQQTSAEYMESCNDQFMKAGAMGISILFASGDMGVWGRTGASKRGTFNPDFPSGSPYVTAVGGTNFQTKSVIGAETTWDCGGKLSMIFDYVLYILMSFDCL